MAQAKKRVSSAARSRGLEVKRATREKLKRAGICQHCEKRRTKYTVCGTCKVARDRRRRERIALVNSLLWEQVYELV